MGTGAFDALLFGKPRPHVPYAVHTLTIRGFLTLSNQPLGSLEGVDQSRPDNSTVPSGTEQSGQTGDGEAKAESEAAPKANPVPKIAGKIAVKPAEPLAEPTDDENEFIGTLLDQWELYRFPKLDKTCVPILTEMIRDLANQDASGGSIIPDVMAWMMFNQQRWLLEEPHPFD
jgi:hypothetical protein